MTNERKIILLVTFFSLLVLIGAAVLLSNSTNKASLQKITGAKIELSEESFEFGDIDYSGGVATHSYKIRNSGDKDLEVANIVTSCMCTQAFVKGPFGEGPKSGMKGMSKPSAWKGIFKPGEEGELIAVFDPAFHGPQGVGSISRSVSFETNDPDRPYVELLFSGNVVK